MTVTSKRSFISADVLSLSTWFGILLAIALIGCKAEETKNTVVAKAVSPDGITSALLVDRYYHAARISDGFFLILTPSRDNPNEAINAEDI